MTDRHFLNSIVGIIHVGDTDSSYLLTTWSFAEAAHHPASLWVSIDKSHPVHHLLERVQRFAISVLHVEQRELAEKCLSGLCQSDKEYRSVATYNSLNGYTFLAGALASSGCNITSQHDLDTHSLFIADIVEADTETRYSHQRQLLLSDLAVDK